jgi:hypothetical protein
LAVPVVNKTYSLILKNQKKAGKMKELTYLRQEIQQRSTFFHEQYHKILWNVMMVWGGTLVLFSTLAKDGTNNGGNIVDKVGITFWFFMIITIFFISVVVLYLSALKDKRNQRDICRTSAYKIVFYDEYPRHNVKKDDADETNEKDEKNYLDLFLFETMRENMRGKPSRKRWKFHKPVIKKPEVILSSIAFFMEACFLSMLFVGSGSDTEIKNVNLLTEINNVNLFLVIVCCLFVLGSFVLLLIITQTSVSKEQRFEMIKNNLKSFIKHAIRIKYYATENDARKKFGDDFWTEVMGLSVKEETEQEGK